MENYLGTPIEADEAWRMFDRWQSVEKETGVIFWGAAGNLYAIGSVASAKNGRLHVVSETVRASFNLAEANFRYGPMQTWPRWPSTPIVEVMALRAELPNGDYLALAEGLRPGSILPAALPC